MKILSFCPRDFWEGENKSGTFSPQIVEQISRLVCKTKGLVAYGNRSDSGFIVYKGSQAVLANRPSVERKKGGHFKRRERLISRAILVEEESNYVFTRDFEFTSPSLAAATICGGAENGLTHWKSTDGRTLKEIEEAESQCGSVIQNLERTS